MDQDSKVVNQVANKTKNAAKKIITSYSKPMNDAFNNFKALFYKHKSTIIPISIIIIAAVIYFTIFFKRVNRGLAVMDKTFGFMTPSRKVLLQ